MLHCSSSAAAASSSSELSKQFPVQVVGELIGLLVELVPPFGLGSVVLFVGVGFPVFVSLFCVPPPVPLHPKLVTEKLPPGEGG